MKNFFKILFLVLVTGCAAGNIGSNPKTPLYVGQWDEPQSVGQGQYLIRGYASQEAMDGATEFCARSNKKYQLINMVLGNTGTAARLIFSCY